VGKGFRDFMTGNLYLIYLKISGTEFSLVRNVHPFFTQHDCSDMKSPVKIFFGVLIVGYVVVYSLMALIA
jgi:hypothetical protein